MMLSLDNAFTPEEIVEFDARVQKGLATQDPIDYVIEVRIDGLAIELVYEDGKFIAGSTRGDGEVGENVTANLRTIKSVPLALTATPGRPFPKKLSVRGEVYLRRKDFAKLNKMREEQGE